MKKTRQLDGEVDKSQWELYDWMVDRLRMMWYLDYLVFLVIMWKYGGFEIDRFSVMEWGKADFGYKD
jgi:hypothetical protein